MVVAHLGWVDSDLGSSPVWWTVIAATCCPTGGWNIPNLISPTQVRDHHGHPALLSVKKCLHPFSARLRESEGSGKGLGRGKALQDLATLVENKWIRRHAHFCSCVSGLYASTIQAATRLGNCLFNVWTFGVAEKTLFRSNI